MDTTTVVTATSTIPTSAATPTTSASALSSIAPSDASGSRVGDQIIQRIDHMTLNINQPQYDFDAPDQHKDFRVFKQQLTSWFILQQIWEFQALPAILSCLGRKGYNIHDEWCADAATKKDWHAFLLHFESTLDTEVGPRVHVYDLEAIWKKKDETAKELVAHIHQMAARALIGDGSTASIEFEVQCRFITDITDEEIELR